MEKLFTAVFKTIITLAIILIIVKYGHNILIYYENHPWMLLATILFLYYYFLK
jgi:multidrug resistance efflux pump